jgi:hypothetical protein
MSESMWFWYRADCLRVTTMKSSTSFLSCVMSSSEGTVSAVDEVKMDEKSRGIGAITCSLKGAPPGVDDMAGKRQRRGPENLCCCLLPFLARAFLC